MRSSRTERKILEILLLVMILIILHLVLVQFKSNSHSGIIVSLLQTRAWDHHWGHLHFLVLQLDILTEVYQNVLQFRQPNFGIVPRQISQFVIHRNI